MSEKIAIILLLLAVMLRGWQISIQVARIGADVSAIRTVLAPVQDHERVHP